ncbi:TlpA disulfide reductase family protein [Lentimicrobium sp. S6]|uniref:TlpA family protein disulfide reductase n=1 Tax=Lentimicrobium sp. S6 TaxID=2735872 RepID=UPI001554AA08|nr:TlpA disulfide reductase family protein [Lentimicrobium sp. S6]NPD45577.1 TlpA family protein disulfide reductase [Lentimicrobium sp. S6]
MKRINFNLLYYLLFLFLLFSCTSKTSKNESIFEKPQKVIITGEIINYNPHSDDYFIKFGFDGLFDIQETTDIEINENGYFKTSFESFFPSNYFFYYQNTIPFYAFPGDSIHFVFNNDSLKKESTQYSHLKFIQYSGDFSQMTTDYFEYSKFYYNEVLDWGNEYYLPQKLDSSEYLKYINIERNNCYQSKSDEFLNEKTRSAFFKGWLKYELKYLALKDLIHYKTNKLNRGSYSYKDNFLPENYSFILEETNFDHINAVCNWNYRSFIRASQRYITSHNLPSDSLEILFQHYRNKERITAFKIQEKMIQKSSSGFGKDLLMGGLYYQLLELRDLETFSYFEDDLLISNSFVKNYLLSKYNELVGFSNSKSTTGINTHSKKTLNNQIFDSIIELYPNKVLYIDIWAPWCGPCMGGIEDSRRLKRKFEDKDIVFIYLGYNCSKISWETTINEKKIKGEHFHLSNNQSSVLSNRFKITGIPRYIIVNKKGEITNTDASSPYEFETLKEEFERLLKE